MRLKPANLAFVASVVLISNSNAAIGKPIVTSRSGVFSDVRSNPETGDLDGLEIEIHADVPKPYAFVVFCEGWCNEFHRAPMVLSGNRFSLRFSEGLLDQDGAPAGVDRYWIHGQLSDRIMVGTLEVNSNREPFQLKRRARRFGLAVAKPVPQQ